MSARVAQIIWFMALADIDLLLLDVLILLMVVRP